MNPVYPTLVEAFQRLGSIKAAADEANVQRSTVRKALRAAGISVDDQISMSKGRAARALQGCPHVDPGISAAMVAAGTNLVPAAAWVKTKPTEDAPGYSVLLRPAEPAPEDVAERVADRLNAVIPAPAIQRPVQTRSDLLAFLPIYDVHLGMRVGNYGTAQAVQRLICGAFDVIDQAPAAQQIIILTGGDYTEANDNSGLTPANQHPTANDMDFDDLVDVAVDTKVAIIERALAKFDRVIYQAIRANHDPSMMHILRQGIRQRYRDDPRIEVKEGRDQLDLFTHAWEGNLIAAIHGHQKVTKPETLALAIATRHAMDWGNAKRRELWRGHNHKEVTIAVPGMRVCQVNAIAPMGRYANENLFTGESDIQIVTYKKGGGRQNVVMHIFDD